MNIIRQLPAHVADLIAAGEVVERPASVVKELMENSFDAGAGQITVEIQRGGMSLIRVTDNGKGMSPEDAQTAFLRHATSKLRDAYGLEAIGTLGFRGEALAAIAAVSRVQLLTRETGAETGVSLHLEAGNILDCTEAGCPEGTTMLVRDLFYNTPARLKFMKKDSAEGAGVTAAVIRAALSRPEVSVRYLKDGKEEFHTPGNGRPEDCVYAVLGRDFARDMMPVFGGEEIRVSGFILPPAQAGGNRSRQYFFLNGRWIRSQLLQTALEQAYRNSLFTGRYPACVLYIEMKLNAADVNVHPAKTEVRFLQEKQVFDAVYHSVLSTLQGETVKPELNLPEPQKPEPTKPEPTKPVPESTKRESVAPIPATPVPATQPPKKPDAERRLTRPATGADNRPPVPEEPRADMKEIVEQLVFRTAEPVSQDEKPTEKPADSEPIPQKDEKPGKEEVPQRAEESAPAMTLSATSAGQETPSYRILGEAFREYIVTECDGELLLIDKHAAHERMIFDRLKANEDPLMSQILMIPQIVKPSPEDFSLLTEQPELLEAAGIEAEDFGGGCLAVRRLPADFAPEEADALLAELADAMRLGRRPGTLGIRDETLATMACKAAVKAGMDSDPREWKPIVEAVVKGEVRYCPHGRPVSMRLTKAQLDRNFRRT